jgi:hypothetical protein
LTYLSHHLQSLIIHSYTPIIQFNNTLAPYKTCPNANDRSKGDRGTQFVIKWADIYLVAARERLQAQLDGYDLTIEDVFTMQQLCAYETVSIGYSRFCELFTEEEWEGFDYSLDLSFWCVLEVSRLYQYS